LRDFKSHSLDYWVNTLLREGEGLESLNEIILRLKQSPRSPEGLLQILKDIMKRSDRSRLLRTLKDVKKQSDCYSGKLGCAKATDQYEDPHCRYGSYM